MKKNFLLLNLLLSIMLMATMGSCKTQSSATSKPTTVNVISNKPIPMILDSDFGSSTDDLFALMMLHRYIDEGRVDLRGIVVDREGEKNAGVVDILNTYYGHPDIPIGLERNGVKHPRCFIPYNGICDMKDAQGNPLFRRTKDTSQCPDGWRLYRRLLSESDDHSVVIVAIGFVTSLAQLMESPADEYSDLNGLDLFARKVKSVYIQSGRFAAGDSLCGYNMRAASKQSAVFYSRFPKNVDLIMSPSNLGDGMDYVPGDVLVDLSYTERNPIKSVYTNYTCSTGQRMWDTNCVAQAVEGDACYHLSPRGWVTFVDRGEESLMLFREDVNGNARYQVPGDSYWCAGKLMDIRRMTRMVPNPSTYTIEWPQPQLTGQAAVEWVRPRMGLLIDKYMGSAGNTLDPDGVRELFYPLGFTGQNVEDYDMATDLMCDTLFTVMMRRAMKQGKKNLTIVTGAPACGKSTVRSQMALDKEGLVYDAALTGPNRLARVIEKAQQEGVEKVTLVMVYNDVLTCYKNTVDRGYRTWRFVGMDHMVNAYRDNIGKLEAVHRAFPDMEIIPIDYTGNQGVVRVSLEEALRWDHEVDEAEMNALFTYLLEVINSGNLGAGEAAQATGDILSIPRIGASNEALAREIDAKVTDMMRQLEAR